MALNNVLCHDNRHLMERFELLHGSGMTCLLYLTTITFISVNALQHPIILGNNINHFSKWWALPFFHANTNLGLDHALVHSVNKNHALVLTVEWVWLLLLNALSFNFVQIPNKSLGYIIFRKKVCKLLCCHFNQSLSKFPWRPQRIKRY